MKPSKNYRFNIRVSRDLKEVIDKECELVELTSSELMRYLVSWYHFQDEQTKRKIVNKGISDLWEIEKPIIK